MGKVIAIANIMMDVINDEPLYIAEGLLRHEEGIMLISANLSSMTLMQSLRPLPSIMMKGTGGGIHVCEGWYASTHYFSSKQEVFLKKLQPGLQTEADQKMMESILMAFAMLKKENV